MMQQKLKGALIAATIYIIGLISLAVYYGT